MDPDSDPSNSADFGVVANLLVAVFPTFEEAETKGVLPSGLGLTFLGHGDAARTKEIIADCHAVLG